jgi:DNA-binding CsgD family transcriptional regulator/tetratricopeptide (TPR) repeat protein
VADLLASVTSRQSVLLALEDIHWADAATLLLLRHLGRSAGDARMLVLATFRDTKADVPADLSEALADLRRSDAVIRMRLTDLSADEVATFVHEAAESDLGADLPELARAISDLTDGNAFLMTELWRSVVEAASVEIADLGSPESVREVVAERLSRVAASTIEVLEVAAVAGPEFRLDLLRRATGLEEHSLLTALEEGVRNGTIDEVPGLGLTYRFTHELVRRALYDRLTASRRAELHLRVGVALEETVTESSGGALAALAHHFAAAGALGDVGRAVDYNRRAAQAAMAALAYDRAAACLETALELGAGNASAQAEMQLELGIACHRAGNSTDALEAFAAAAGIARELGDADTLARAAIWFEEACWLPGLTDRRAVDFLEEAAAALGEADSRLRVSVLSGLARSLVFRGDDDRGAVVRANAVEMARRLGDRRGLAALLARAYWTRGTNTIAEIRDMLTEARDLSEELGDVQIQSEASGWLAFAEIALGDLRAARRELAAYLDIAQQSRQPALLFTAEHMASVIALCEGHLDEAEARAERSREWETFLDSPTLRSASGIHGIQMFSIRREQGRLDELRPLIRGLADRAGEEAPWPPGLVALLVELGMEDEARLELARIRGEGLDRFRDGLWLASVVYLADACAAVADAELAELLVPELEPFAGSPVVVGRAVACYGAADRYLGMLAATLGDADLAERRFEAASELNRRMGADTWLAHTHYQHARLLFARGGAEARGRAAALQADAAERAERIGMPALLDRIRALGAPAPPTVAFPDGLSPREIEIIKLVARGLSNRKIGEELFISEHTAANHIRSILRKTSCANRTEAASYAHRHGFLES